MYMHKVLGIYLIWYISNIVERTKDLADEIIASLEIK